jgi:hypothetical protein
MNITEILNATLSDFSSGHTEPGVPFHTSYIIHETGGGDQFGGSDSWFHVSWSERDNKFSPIGYIKNTWNISNHFANPGTDSNSATYWYAKMEGDKMIWDRKNYKGHYKADVSGKTGGALEGLASSIKAVKIFRN